MSAGGGLGSGVSGGGGAASLLSIKQRFGALLSASPGWVGRAGFPGALFTSIEITVRFASNLHFTPRPDDATVWIASIVLKPITNEIRVQHNIINYCYCYGAGVARLIHIFYDGPF